MYGGGGGGENLVDETEKEMMALVVSEWSARALASLAISSDPSNESPVLGKVQEVGLQNKQECVQDRGNQK